ncbi:glycosyltransferase, partial [Candidatus Omnitrophota bacterium]
MAKGRHKKARQIIYRPLLFRRKFPGRSSFSIEKREIEKIVEDLKKADPAIIVIPAAQDTHRHHVRLRELILKAARKYVTSTGKALTIYSVPLSSAEKEAYDKSNRFILQNQADCSDKRYVLNAFLSQWQYTGDRLYMARHEESLRRAEDVLESIEEARSRRPRETIASESFTEELLLPEKAEHPKFNISAWENNQIRLSGVIDETLYAIDCEIYGETQNGRTKKHLKITQVQALNSNTNVWDDVTDNDIAVMDSIADSLLKEIYARDTNREMIHERLIPVARGYEDPLDYLSNQLRIKHFSSMPDDDEDMITSLKIFFEEFIRDIEDKKIEKGMLASGAVKMDETRPDNKWRGDVSVKEHKLIIGIPTYRSTSIIASKLRNIRDQINDFPKEWQDLKVEIVLCANDEAKHVDEEANQIAVQIPKDVFEGIKNPVKITFFKERHASQPNAIHAIYKYAEETGATLVAITDDDVEYKSHVLKLMIEKILEDRENHIVGARFHWRRRSREELHNEAFHNLKKNHFARILNDRVLSAFSRWVVVPAKQCWQEITIFRRRPDIELSPKVLMGAASITRIEDYKGIPYWMRQCDVWWRYRYASKAVLLTNAHASSVAARNLLYYWKKRARSFYGYQKDINTIFSEERRQIQKDDDVYYNIRSWRSEEVRSLGLKDKAKFVLNVTLYAFSDLLFRFLPFIFKKIAFSPREEERGADPSAIPSDERMLGLRVKLLVQRWKRLSIDPD